jgi:hypothetical protein
LIWPSQGRPARFGPALDGQTVRGREVARHPRIWGKEQVCFEPLHYLALLEKKPGALDHARPLDPTGAKKNTKDDGHQNCATRIKERFHEGRIWLGDQDHGQQHHDADQPDHPEVFGTGLHRGGAHCFGCGLRRLRTRRNQEVSIQSNPSGPTRSTIHPANRSRLCMDQACSAFDE